ncbi:MAG: protoporphyrinogen oxidase [Paludibacter sp.]|nr:protoporphyrinogen oxidase [Paludibacter sp.]
MTTNNSIIKTDVVVLGAGLTGLTTAYYLHKNNKSFIVLEKQNHVGGVIQSHQDKGFTHENGPNTGVIGNTTVVELFEELSGKCNLQIGGKNVSKRYILKHGQWKHLPMGPVDAVTTPLFTLKDKFRILGEPFRKPGTDPHETLTGFVKRRMGQSYLNYAIDPFIIGVYAGDPNYLVPKYALPKLYNLEQKYGSLIGGSVKKGFAEKKTEAEKKVSRKTFSFEGGLSSLINALYESAEKENFVTGAKDVVVAKNEEYLVSYTDKNGDKINIQAANVISTVGAYALSGLFPFIDKTAISKIDNLLYGKVIEVSLGFNHWDGVTLDGFGGLIPSIEKRDILGVLYMSALFPGRAPEGGALLSVFMGGVRHQELVDKTDEEIKKIIERELKDLMQLQKFNPDLIYINRHQKAIPQYGAESGERFSTIEMLEKQYPGLQIGGNLRGGIGMADRIKQGKELAERIL